MAGACGFALAWLDSRPGWDDTGITATALMLVSGSFAFVAGRRPWLWALLVGAWVPALEIPGTAGAASLLALAFAAFGAACGYFAARRRGSSQGVRPRA